MTQYQFHEQKENQIKSLNVIIQSVKANPFLQNEKEKIIAHAAQAIDSINIIRTEVYKQLDNMDFSPENYDHNNANNAAFAIRLRDVNKLPTLKNQMTTELSVIISQMEKETVDKIVQQNFQAFTKNNVTKALHESVISLVETVKDIITNGIKETKKEEVITEEENKKPGLLERIFGGQ